MSRRGFTLIEVVIALAIAATAFVAIAASLRSGVQKRVQVAHHERISAELAAKLSQIICRQETATSGSLKGGSRWILRKSLVFIAGTGGLVQYEIGVQDEPGLNLRSILAADEGR